MPPRIAVHCPGCDKAFHSENSLRRHRSHITVRDRPCYIHFQEEPRVSAWAPAAAGAAAGRLDVSMADREQSPDPGDDLADPPSDFDEDLLGDGQPPGGAAMPGGPAQVIYIYVPIRTAVYHYIPICTTRSPSGPLPFARHLRCSCSKWCGTCLVWVAH
jgi:hypothetical protein